MKRIISLFTVAALSVACGSNAASTADGSTAFVNPEDDLIGAVPTDLSNRGKHDLGTSSDNHQLDGSVSSGDPTPDPNGPALIAARPYNTKIPDNYDGSTPVPLIVLLHGFTADGQLQDFYLQLGQYANSQGWLFALPDGLQDPAGLRYWDATDACCNFADPPQDDVGYLNAVIDDMKSKYNVDNKRVFIFGHSNGGFMAHRMACDSADRVAAVISLEGAMWKNTMLCDPHVPVGVLEVHGNLDAIIMYGGGTLLNANAPYPGAKESISDWASLNGCGAVADTNETIDAEAIIIGNETQKSRATGCQKNGAAELWTVNGGSHVPILTDAFRKAALDFLSAHAKP